MACRLISETAEIRPQHYRFAQAMTISAILHCLFVKKYLLRNWNKNVRSCKTGASPDFSFLLLYVNPCEAFFPSWFSKPTSFPPPPDWEEWWKFSSDPTFLGVLNCFWGMPARRGYSDMPICYTSCGLIWQIYYPSHDLVWQDPLDL